METAHTVQGYNINVRVYLHSYNSRPGTEHPQMCTINKSCKGALKWKSRFFDFCSCFFNLNVHITLFHVFHEKSFGHCDWLRSHREGSLLHHCATIQLPGKKHSMQEADRGDSLSSGDKNIELIITWQSDWKWNSSPSRYHQDGSILPSFACV